jgi:hypothetical protein
VVWQGTEWTPTRPLCRSLQVEVRFSDVKRQVELGSSHAQGQFELRFSDVWGRFALR